MEQDQWRVGDIARTPWEPSGLVKILSLEPAGTVYDECAFVEFVEDHPMGYKKGEPGRYQLKDLRQVNARELMRLPLAERRAVMARQAEIVLPEYLTPEAIAERQEWDC